jgi:hypothetical protein
MGAANDRGDVRRTKGEAMAKKKKKKAAKRAARKATKKAIKKRAARKTKSARKAPRAGKKKISAAAKMLPAAAAAGLLSRVQPPVRVVKPQSTRQDSLREAMPDDIEIDDDLADEVPDTMREGMDDEEPLDEEGRNDYLDKPDDLSGEDEE